MLTPDNARYFLYKYFHFIQVYHIKHARFLYGNSAIERYLNTLKSELVYLHYYSSEDKFFADIYDYVLFWNNSVISFICSEMVLCVGRNVKLGFWGTVLQFCLAIATILRVVHSLETRTVIFYLSFNASNAAFVVAFA